MVNQSPHSQRMGWLAVLAVITVCGSAFPSHAELYRCQQPDGSVTYTNNQALCPGAQDYEPQATIQQVTRPSSVTQQAPARRVLGPRTETPVSGRRDGNQRR